MPRLEKGSAVIEGNYVKIIFEPFHELISDRDRFNTLISSRISVSDLVAEPEVLINVLNAINFEIESLGPMEISELDILRVKERDINVDVSPVLLTQSTAPKLPSSLRYWDVDFKVQYGKLKALSPDITKHVPKFMCEEERKPIWLVVSGGKVFKEGDEYQPLELIETCKGYEKGVLLLTFVKGAVEGMDNRRYKHGVSQIITRVFYNKIPFILCLGPSPPYVSELFHRKINISKIGETCFPMEKGLNYMMPEHCLSMIIPLYESLLISESVRE